MTPSVILDYAGKVTTTLVLLAVIYAVVTGTIVTGPVYNEMKSDRDAWKTLALKGTALASDVPRGITASPVTSLPPLPVNPSLNDVKDRLKTVEAVSGYKTEPTDKPLQ